VTSLVPIARLLAGHERFACARLHATLTAATCAARQRVAHATLAKGSFVGEAHATTCKRCPDGDAVRARLAGGAR
jgi:hypothetical protein